MVNLLIYTDAFMLNFDELSGYLCYCLYAGLGHHPAERQAGLSFQANRSARRAAGASG